jgi:hypothetical protein
MTDPFARSAELQEAFAKVSAAVDQVTAGLDDYERERALFALVSAWSLAEEMWIFKGDPAEPAFTDWMAYGRKTAGDSPYTVYKTAPLSPRHVYRLYGNMGQATYFGAQLYMLSHGFNALSGVISQDQIVTDDEGNFEIILSAERPANVVNWLQLAPDDYVIMTREYRYDPAQETPMWTAIERLDEAPAQPVPFAQRVATAIAYFESIVLSTIEIAGMLRVNQFSPPDAEVRVPKYGGSLFPNRDTYYDGFFVKLEPGQAIRMQGRLPEHWVYISFVFYDRWYATLDYPQVRCYLTAKDLQFNPDGTYTIYLSAEDPGHPNWIQMGALHEGLYSYRYMLADSNPKPAIDIVTINKA